MQKKLSVGFEYLGERRPKNFSETVSVYSVAPAADVVASGKRASKKRPAAGAKTTGWAGLLGSAQRYAFLWAILFALDLATGSPFWSQWPALGLGLLLAFKALPLIGRTD